jgi:hypothetical protein
MMEFDEWYDKWQKETGPGWDRVSREDAEYIWEAAQNVIKAQMINALIPKLNVG